MASEPLTEPLPAPLVSEEPLLLELQRRDAEVGELRLALDQMERRMQDELRLAASVQRALLRQPRDFKGLDFAREFLPFREVGGDYYDVVELDGRRTAVAIGDVMGKGVPAALLVATLKSSVRSELRASAFPLADFMARVNKLFFEVTPRGRFASLFVAALDRDSGRLDYVNAGHDYPFLVRADGSCDELIAGATVLGLVEDARYEAGSVAFESGDLLVLYTDGVSDRLNAEGETYGHTRLQQAAARIRQDPARIVLYSLLGEVQGWSAGCPAEDDMTLLIAKRS